MGGKGRLLKGWHAYIKGMGVLGAVEMGIEVLHGDEKES